MNEEGSEADLETTDDYQLPKSFETSLGYNGPAKSWLNELQ